MAGTVLMTRHVLPVMRTARRGIIINISSIGRRIGTPFASAYYTLLPDRVWRALLGAGMSRAPKLSRAAAPLHAGA